MVAMYKGGDLLGSLYTGHWHEAISVGAASTLRPDDCKAPIHRLSSALGLPNGFVIENNQFAYSTPDRMQSN